MALSVTAQKATQKLDFGLVRNIFPIFIIMINQDTLSLSLMLTDQVSIQFFSGSIERKVFPLYKPVVTEQTGN